MPLSQRGSWVVRNLLWTVFVALEAMCLAACGIGLKEPVGAARGLVD